MEHSGCDGAGSEVADEKHKGPGLGLVDPVPAWIFNMFGVDAGIK